MRSRKGRTATHSEEKAAEKRLPEEEDGEEYGDVNASEEELEEGKGFFACYLLASLCPRHKGRTYIGFTVNPRRRIRQHNGEIRCGASRTKRGRPWEMALCIYGFPSNVSALQFEWAWQHPKESLAVRKAALSFKSLSGIANKIKLAYTMLSLPAWENLNATVNFFSTKYMKYIDGCPKLPKQMKTIFCVMDELPCYIKGPILDDSIEEDYHEDDDKESSISACWEVKGDHAQLTVRDSPDRRRKDDHFRESMESEASPRSIGSPKAKEKSISYDPKVWRGFSSAGKPMETTESYCLIESPELGQEESRILVDATPMSCTEDLFSLAKRKDLERCLALDSTPRSCSSNRQILSPDCDVINLVTPPSFLISSCRNKQKKNPVGMGIIDLTDSPISL